MSDINYAYCQCGCGMLAPIANRTDVDRKWVKGSPISFISGHNCKLMPKGKFSHRWNGGLYINKRVFIYMPKHCRASGNGYVLRAIFVAEKALGKPLPINALVHHHDRDTTNDNNSNLVVCDSQAYHFLLHKRTRSYLACGNANWIKCKICKKYDDPKNLCISRGKSYHKICINSYNRNYYKKTKNNGTNT